MPLQNHPYAFPMIASALVLGINAIYTWQRRRAKGALALFWLMLASMVWALGSIPFR